MNRIGLVCVLTAVVLVPNVFAADRCTLDKWGGARPPAKSYGPDDNEYINPTHALKLTIPRGRTAHFEFSTHGPESEPAMMIYSLNFAEQLAERGTGGNKGMGRYGTEDSHHHGVAQRWRRCLGRRLHSQRVLNARSKHVARGRRGWWRKRLPRHRRDDQLPLTANGVAARPRRSTSSAPARSPHRCTD